MTDKNDLKPNVVEKAFLSLAYNRFYDIFEEIISDSFWEKDHQYRFSRIKDIFGAYSELLNYEPLKWTIEHLKRIRLPMEAEIGGELLKIIRHIITHFPFFDIWDDIWIDKQIINWNKEQQSADKFFRKYEGHEQVKYRFWEADKKRMTYLSINFPKNYTKGDKIFLKDILTEKEGVRFSIILMRKILTTQVEEIKESK